MVLIAAKMTDRLQVQLILLRDFTISLRRIKFMVCAHQAGRIMCQSSPLCCDVQLASMLDKGFFRRYSERHM
jgi:hypothetical protein